MKVAVAPGEAFGASVERRERPAHPEHSRTPDRATNIPDRTPDRARNIPDRTPDRDRATNIPDPCPFDPHGGRGQVKRLIACEAALWDVPGGAARAFAVAYCESRFQPAAFNPTGCGGSGCGGLFQQSLRYWPERAATYGFAGRPASDPRANVVVSMRLAVDRGTWARDWPVCGR